MPIPELETVSRFHNLQEKATKFSFTLIPDNNRISVCVSLPSGHSVHNCKDLGEVEAFLRGYELSE